MQNTREEPSATIWKIGEQVCGGGVPESLWCTKEGGRGRSLAVVAWRRDEFEWTCDLGHHEMKSKDADKKRNTDGVLTDKR